MKHYVIWEHSIINFPEDLKENIFEGFPCIKKSFHACDLIHVMAWEIINLITRENHFYPRP